MDEGQRSTRIFTMTRDTYWIWEALVTVNTKHIKRHSSTSPLNIKRCLFEDTLSVFTPVFACWPTKATAITGLPPTAPCTQWPLSVLFSRVVCLPSPTAFQIHFQVNTAWPTTNLQPTGVVTAVADNGKSKLQPRSGMFTVTAGKLAVNIFFFCHFFQTLSKRETFSLLILFWWITCLTSWPIQLCVTRYSEANKGKS